MDIVLSALKTCELQLREYVQWHHKNAGGCSVEMESAWEKARDAIAVAEAEAQQRALLLKVLQAAYLHGGGYIYQEEFGRVCFCPRYGKPGRHATACDDLNAAIQPLLSLLDNDLRPDILPGNKPANESALAMVRELYELALVAIRTGGDPLSDPQAWKPFQSEPDGKDATLNRARAMLGIPLVAKNE